MNKYFAIASLVASSMFAGQSGTVEAGHGCPPNSYSHPTYKGVPHTQTSSIAVATPVPAPVATAGNQTGTKAPQPSPSRQANSGATPPGPVAQPTPPATMDSEPAPAPVAAMVKPKGKLVPQGSQLRLKANFLGREPGHVFFLLNTTSHPCEILDWQVEYVIVKLPGFSVSENTAGKLVIATNDGSLKRKVDIVITPTPDVEVIPTDEIPPMAPTELFND